MSASNSCGLRSTAACGRWSNLGATSARRPGRSNYLKRLRQTALKIPKTLIDKAIGDMRRRCQMLVAAQGGHIEEGGN